MENNNNKFTAEEFHMLSEGVLALIENTNKALRLTSDKSCIEALENLNMKYRDLNSKVCDLWSAEIKRENEKEYTVSMFSQVDIVIKAASPQEAHKKAVEMYGEHHNESFDYVYFSEINNIVDADGNEVQEVRTVLKLKSDGYVYVSDRNIEYELLEGMSIGSEQRHTSDIIFIMLNNEDYNVDNNVVGYLFGADIFLEDQRYYEESIKEMVDEFEKRNFGK